VNCDLPTNSILVYTSITGNRDTERTDIPVYKDCNIFTKPVLNAKIYKILPHLFFPEYQTFMWVDGNIFLKKDKQYYVDEYLYGYDVATFKHPQRDNIYQEIEVLKNRPYYPEITNVVEQVESYKKQGFNKDLLYEANVIIRRNNKRTNQMFESWWAQITRWQYRDQISFPFIANKHYEVKINMIRGNIRYHEDFIYNDHESTTIGLNDEVSN
jgi:hypothetical protein